MSFESVEWMLALRYLGARRKEGFVSVITGFSLAGIALGVAILIIVMAVMNGFRIELLSRLLSVNGHALVQAGDHTIQNYDQIAATLLGVPGVTQAAPIIEGEALLETNGRNSGALLRAFEPSDLRKLPFFSSSIIRGNLADFSGPSSVVIGSRLAGQLGVDVGSTVMIFSGRDWTQTPFGRMPRATPFEIVAIVDIGVSYIDSGVVYIPLEAAQSLFNVGHEAFWIEVFVQDPDRVEAYEAAMSKALGPDFTIGDWRARNANLFQAIQVQRNALFLVLMLIVLVAALNIISGLVMLVKDKGQEIGILRSMGVSRGAILRIFFIVGAGIGITGTSTGVIVGILFSQNIEALRQFLSRMMGTALFDPKIYFLSAMPAQVEPLDVVLVAGTALALSFLATFYPAFRAASLDPIDALRYE